MKYAVPFIVLLLSLPLCAMEKEEEGLQRLNKNGGETTIRIKAQKKRATLQILQGTKDLEKLEREEQQHRKRKDIRQRRETMRVLLQAAKKPCPPKALSDSDLRRTKTKKSLKNFFGLRNQKKGEKEEASQEVKGHRRRGSRSMGELNEKVKEELFKEFQKRFSINLGSEESSSQPEEEPFSNTLPIPIAQPSSDSEENDLDWQPNLSNPKNHSL